MQQNKIKIGVLLPTRENAVKGTWGMAPLLDFARNAEAAGADSLWVGDSLLARPRPDAYLVMAGLAAATTGITLGAACVIPALRDPVIAGNMITTLDHAVGDRLQVAVGSGFGIPVVQHEFAAADVPFDKRVGWLDDALLLWRQSWGASAPGRTDGSEGPLFDGRYWQVDGLDQLARPATPGGPGIWYAGSDTPRVTERVAEFYDGWLPFLPTPEAYAAAWIRIQEIAAERGRPDGAIYPAMYITLSVDEDRERAKANMEEYVQAYYGYPLEISSYVQAFRHGTAEDCAEAVAEYVRAGARHIVIRIGSLQPGPPIGEILEAVRTACDAAYVSLVPA